jgi:hypothetical protein
MINYTALKPFAELALAVISSTNRRKIEVVRQIVMGTNRGNGGLEQF